MKPLSHRPVDRAGVLAKELERRWLAIGNACLTTDEFGQAKAEMVTFMVKNTPAILTALNSPDQGWRDIATAPTELPIDVWVAPEGMVPCRVTDAHQTEDGRWYDGNGNRIWLRPTHWTLSLPPKEPAA